MGADVSTIADHRPVMRRRAPGARTVFAVASLGVFMAFVDATIVNIAFPDIAALVPGGRDLDACRGS